MTKLKTLDLNEKIDYKEVGFMSGLEIHQQLNTGKLFCTCPCEILDNSTFDKEITRKLRFSLSETGSIDKAAKEEQKKDKYNIYKYNDKCSCLVELDEMPPSKQNQKAFDTAIRVSQMFNLKFFDKIQFMRKLIIDGSVTTGFQKTAMLGTKGKLNTEFGDVVIEGVNIEEDSCRTLERFNDHTVFALDRQGIPLIEITTGPQINTPEMGYAVAKQLGNVLRSFSETKRGLGTIRQDVNVSIKGGARVEIKGAQNLKLIPEILKSEIRRQQIHLSIIEELKNRGTTIENFSDFKTYDVTKLFEKTESTVLLNNLEGEKKGVLAIKLNKFSGVLGHEMNTNYRFASEISDRNKKHFPTIKGLFHTDELPKYGITEDEVEAVRKELNLEEEDAFILIANDKDIAEKSLNNVLKIIKLLISEIPEEVRQVDPKGTVTTFSRPMPGSARMYPETDVKTIELTNNYLEEQESNIPELYDVKMSRLNKAWNLDENKIEDVLSKYSEEEFSELVKIKLKPSQIYSTIFDTPKEIKKREKIETFDFNINLIKNILKKLSEDKLNKNSVYDLMTCLTKDKLNDLETLDTYLEEKNLVAEEVNLEEVEKKIKEIIDKNTGAPFGALMGQCMKAFGGSVDGKIISQTLKKLM